MDEIRNYTMEEFTKFSIRELARIRDLQLVILKGHILVEYTLNCYLEVISKSDDSDFFKENFSFADKIKIAKHFGELGDKNQNFIKELTILNKMRNAIAHSLKYNEKYLDELFVEVYKKSNDSEYTEKNRPKIERFKGAIAFITGAIFGAYKFYTDREDLDGFIKEKK